MTIREFIGWFSLADYDHAKHQAEIDNLSRWTRGNVLAQSGAVLDGPELEALSREGDAAIVDIQRHLPTSI